ncbi:MAG: FecR family protein [Paludibacteraceae bacterium]
MASNEIDNLIYKFITKVINKEELQVLVIWINENSENKKYLQDLINIYHIVDSSVKIDEINTDQALQKVIKEINSQQKARINIIELWKKIAAILIIPLLGWTIYSTASSLKTHQTDVAFQEVTSPYGTKSTIVLPDGSNVWLNSGSKLKFPTRFTNKCRNVYLVGEGFFKVKSDKKNPFIVHTNFIDVKATGTEFNVDAYNEDSITSVSLKEGTVDILYGKNEIRKMKPDEHLVFNHRKKIYNLVTANTSYICAWKDGVLAFRDEPLGDVFKRISRTYNVDIVVKDNAIANQLYRATFEKESLDQILRLLQLSAPIKYKRTSRELNSNNEYSKEKIEVFKK